MTILRSTPDAEVEQIPLRGKQQGSFEGDHPGVLYTVQTHQVSVTSGNRTIGVPLDSMRQVALVGAFITR